MHNGNETSPIGVETIERNRRRRAAGIYVTREN
jgi:hypothetical protein